MRESSFTKLKIPSSRIFEKKEPSPNALQTEDLKRKLYDIDSTVKNASLE